MIQLPLVLQLVMPLRAAWQPRILLRHGGGPGVSGYDLAGRAWITYHVINPDSFDVCAICGEPITQGYESGLPDPRLHVCCRHVDWARG